MSQQKPKPVSDFGLNNDKDAMLEMFDVLRIYHIPPDVWLRQQDDIRADLLTILHEFVVIHAQLAEQQQRQAKR